MKDNKNKKHACNPMIIISTNLVRIISAPRKVRAQPKKGAPLIAQSALPSSQAACTSSNNEPDDLLTVVTSHKWTCFQIIPVRVNFTCTERLPDESLNNSLFKSKFSLSYSKILQLQLQKKCKLLEKQSFFGKAFI